MTTPDIDTLRAAYLAATERAAQLSTTEEAHRKRLPEIVRELGIALAEADTDRVAALRAERATIETELGDIMEGIRVAIERAEAADRALAVAEVPLLYAEARADGDAFAALVKQALQLANRIVDRRRSYQMRFAKAGNPLNVGHPQHPNNILGALTTADVQVFKVLASYSEYL